jgi:hypothetical protein
MAKRQGDQVRMPDVPKQDLMDALAEIWFQISFAAYHLAYVGFYSNSAALRTKPEYLRQKLKNENQVARDRAQADIVICRAHLASFFWHLEHVFEALRTAIIRGQEQHPEIKYFWTVEKRLNKIDQHALRQKIRAYRNMGHQNPAIIGCSWDAGGHFLHHFLPTISGHQKQEKIDMNTRLQQLFEFAVSVWLMFVPRESKERLPRDFRFPVTVPYMYLGQLPKELRATQQLEVVVQLYKRETADEKDVER